MTRERLGRGSAIPFNCREFPEVLRYIQTVPMMPQPLPPPHPQPSSGRFHEQPRFPGCLLALGLLLALATAPRAHAQTNDISLARDYPLEQLPSLLLPSDAWQPYPRHADRAGWEVLTRQTRDLLVRRGNETLSQPFPSLPATLYLRYAREGDRGRFESAYFGRRRYLHQLVLAECAEGQRRFLDPIADALWAICEESSWCVPAHIATQKAGVGLPDVTEPIVDLFAAQTASSVAWTLYLLGPELDTVSPRIRSRAQLEVHQRILEPYLARDFGWMGFSSRSPANRPNNWNPWINGNVLTAALLLEPDPDRRSKLVHRVLRSLDRFLQPHPSDGGCDEGPGYWSRAGGSLLDNLDLLHDASNGRIDVFGHALVREIGRFIHRVHIARDWFVDIGDCSARTGIDRAVVFRYGTRIEDQPLQALACHGVTLESLADGAADIDLGRELRSLVDLEPMLARAASPEPLVRDAWFGSADLQMMVARDRAGTTAGLFLAAWGGHNAQSHNHNDVGNFIVFADGHPVLVDLGAPTYTAKTFGSRRYEIPAMQSAWHNLPTINGVMQSAGRAFAARNVAYQATDASAELSMDIAPAWPAHAKVLAWQRTLRLDRGTGIQLTDAFRLTDASPGPVLGLITPTEPILREPGHLEMPLPANPGQPPAAVTLRYNARQLDASIVAFDLDDRRLAATWGPRLRRILFAPKQPVLVDTWTLELGVRR